MKALCLALALISTPGTGTAVTPDLLLLEDGFYLLLEDGSKLIL